VKVWFKMAEHSNKTGTNVTADATADVEPELTSEVDRDALRKDISTAPTAEPPVTQQPSASVEAEAPEPAQEAAQATSAARANGLYIVSNVKDFRDTEVKRGSPLFYGFLAFQTDLGGSIHLVDVKDAPNNPAGEAPKIGTFSLRIGGEEVSNIDVPQTKKGLLELGVEINRILRDYNAVHRLSSSEPELVH
jgi:hypothetical protein